MKLTNLFMILLVFLANDGHALDLRSAMGTKEFAAAGLDKLSAQELQNLETWLARQEANAAPGPAQAQMPPAPPAVTRTTEAATVPPIKSAEAPKYEAFEAEVMPDFQGFRGKGTRIKLSNGQVWEQTDSTTSPKLRGNLQVRVRPAFGRWRMQLKDNNIFANVQRIE